MEIKLVKYQLYSCLPHIQFGRQVFHGDKGTVSKVFNYKQPLSLNMIRIFSKLLRIPADALTKEYKLQ